MVYNYFIFSLNMSLILSSLFSFVILLITIYRMRLLRLVIILNIFLLIVNSAIAQEIIKKYNCCGVTVSSKDEIIPNKFYEEVLVNIIFDQINYFLEEHNFQSKKKDSVLIRAAKDQSIYMAKTKDVNTIRSKKNNRYTKDRLIASGGSGLGVELVTKNNIRSGKIPYNYAKVANDVVFRWFASSKTVNLFESTKYDLVGIGVTLDEKKVKVYISLIFGNYKSFNDGVKYISQLKVPYTTKTKGLKPQDYKTCKKLNRYNNLIDLQKGLTVQDNVIYFETDDLSSFKKIINLKKDGIAVDILQKSQFNCSYPNIIDYSKINQGILTKKIFSKKLFKNNIAEDSDNKNKFKVEIATLPQGIDEDVELNLVVIKDKSVCKILYKSFLIKPDGCYKKNINFIADTITINTTFRYKPETDSIKISMKIPFENNKYTYKQEDIEKFISLLEEPKFIIYKLQITAYSSIEGAEQKNKILQEKRAKSIEKALENRQATVIETDINTLFNWDDFRKDIKNTKYSKLGDMSMHEAREYISKNKLAKELEPILQNHRYAQIDMSIYYDISGDNEQPYVLKKINDAINDEDNIMALYIEKYIMKQILNGRYSMQILDKIKIPYNNLFAGLLMNKIWLKYHFNKITIDEYSSEVDSLYSLAPDNEYILFNNSLLKVESEKPFKSLNEADLLQIQVDNMYYTSLTKNIIDAVNIKLQIKKIEYADSINSNVKIKKQYLNKLKQVIDLNNETIENTLKLANIFIENNDYKFALELLEYKITSPDVTKELLLSYVSLCSRVEERMHTQKFNFAMGRIYHLDSNLFCKLFNGNYFSFKLLENNYIKKKYCKYCNKKQSN